MDKMLILKWLSTFGILNSSVLGSYGLVPKPRNPDSQNKTKSIIPENYIKEQYKNRNARKASIDGIAKATEILAKERNQYTSFFLYSTFDMVLWKQHIQRYLLFGCPQYEINISLEIRPPTMRGSPIEIDFSMRVVDINSINVEDMDFRMDMFLKQEWQDARLKIPEEMFDYGDDSITLPSQFFENLWQPDLYFLNSKVVEIATLTHKFSSVTLFKNKTIRYAARMHAIVACQMEFQHYPMDTQVCPIAVESFSYNNNKMILKWSGAGVSLSPELKLLQYNILPLHLREAHEYTNEKNGNFSRLVVYFRFERQIGHHLIQTFAPSTLVVVLSWFSFWLDLDAIPARVTLLVTCLLTLVTMFTGLRSDIPAVAYIKALDLWMAGCMISVFAALGEFVIVKVLYGKYNLVKAKEAKMSAQESALAQWVSQPPPKYVHHFRYRHMGKDRFIKLYWKTNNGKERVMWKQIDRTCRIIFPSFFFIFCMMYWTILIFGCRHKY